MACIRYNTYMYNEYLQSVGAYGNSVWNKSPKLCHNDLKGGRGCDALQIMGDCIGRFGGNHWMTKEGM
jgi:hypothetical protein